MATFFVCSLIEFAKFGCGCVKPITPKNPRHSTTPTTSSATPPSHIPFTHHQQHPNSHPTRNTPSICDQAPPATPWTTSYSTPFQSHPQSTSTNKHSPDTITYHRQHAFRPPPTTPQHPLRHLPPHSAIKHHHQQSNNSPSKFCDQTPTPCTTPPCFMIRHHQWHTLDDTLPLQQTQKIRDHPSLDLK